MMFVFEIRVLGNPERKEHAKIDEVEFVRLLRILKIRNRKMYNEFNSFYDKVCEG
jgi:hypothetical protein